MRSPPHMYAGREAMATGVCAVLKPSDQVVGYYRGHGYYLAKGGDPKSFMSELYCKETGSNEGKGGSMLISSPKVGYVGSSAIVAGLATARDIKSKIPAPSSFAATAGPIPGKSVNPNSLSPFDFLDFFVTIQKLLMG